MRLIGFVILFLITTIFVLLNFLFLPLKLEWRYILLFIGSSVVYSFITYLVMVFIINRHLKWMRENIQRAIEYLKEPHTKYPECGVASDIMFNLLEMFKQRQESVKRDIAKRDEFIKWLTEEVNRCAFELNRRNKEFMEKERSIALSHLIATLAHKLGTPLNSIYGHIQLLLNNNQLDYDTKSKLKIVSNEISRIEKIIRQALDVLTLDRGKVEAIDIKELLSEIVDFMLPSLSRDAETIELVVDPDLKIVYSDGDMLREVVINLIANANESMEGKGFIRLSAGRRDDNKCYISVTDTGVGIPKELQEKIFEPFFTTKQKGRASGLGLTISKEIARLLGGDIEVESVVGKGSTFTFTFADRREGPDEEVTDIGGR